MVAAAAALHWRRRRRRGVNETAAFRWRHWRRRRERGVGVGGDGDHYGGDGGGGEAGGGGGLGWLKGSMPNALHKGGGTVSVVPFGARNCVASLPWAHPRKLPKGKGTDEDLITESFGHQREKTGLCASSRIPDRLQYTISQPQRAPASAACSASARTHTRTHPIPIHSSPRRRISITHHRREPFL